MKYLVTGCAGFIGFNLSKKLLEKRSEVIGIDNLNNYYSPKLKRARLEILKKYQNFIFYKIDISNYSKIFSVLSYYKPEKICHLAAQAGVRFSLENPFTYEKSNMLGFLNILEAMRRLKLKNLVYASSSSVYGGIKKVPFKETMTINKPISLYAATKAANELYAHVYSCLFKINAIGLRFFTVYGPWGRPDMALFLFTKAILNDEPIKVFNYGKMKRDFTYIDDIVEGILSALNKVEKLKFEIINLGSSKPILIKDLIRILENYLGKKAKKEYFPLQPGDVLETYADISKAKKLLGYQPKVKFEEGLKNFISWYLDFYKIKK